MGACGCLASKEGNRCDGRPTEIRWLLGPTTQCIWLHCRLRWPANLMPERSVSDSGVARVDRCRLSSMALISGHGSMGMATYARSRCIASSAPSSTTGPRASNRSTSTGGWPRAPWGLAATSASGCACAHGKAWGNCSPKHRWPTTNSSKTPPTAHSRSAPPCWTRGNCGGGC